MHFAITEDGDLLLPYLSRIWCVYEVYTACSSKPNIPFKVLLPPSTVTVIKDISPTQIGEEIKKVDVRKATSSEPRDRERILKYLDDHIDGGATTVNRTVSKRLVDELLTFYNEVLEETIGISATSATPASRANEATNHSLVGKWLYGNGRSYDIIEEGVELVFREKALRGVLEQKGSWSEAVLTNMDTGEIQGNIRLRMLSGSIHSKFKGPKDDEWGVFLIVAERKTHVDKVDSSVEESDSAVGGSAEEASIDRTEAVPPCECEEGSQDASGHSMCSCRKFGCLWCLLIFSMAVVAAVVMAIALPPHQALIPPKELGWMKCGGYEDMEQIDPAMMHMGGDWFWPETTAGKGSHHKRRISEVRVDKGWSRLSDVLLEGSTLCSGEGSCQSMPSRFHADRA
jgi:hypothetical protein